LEREGIAEAHDQRGTYKQKQVCASFVETRQRYDPHLLSYCLPVELSGPGH
jgi:hypothetical protein